MKSTAKPWDSLLSEEDKQVVLKGGYGKQRGLGIKPLIVVIDVQYNYVGDDKPILDQIDEWPSGGGASGWRAIENIEILLKKSRSKNVPVLYTRNVQKEISFDSFSSKTERDQSKYIEGHKGTMIVNEIAPQNDDLVLDKAYASAFYGTPLLSWLIKLRVDTLILVGGSTSGCVRASAIDAVSRNFNVAVIEECTYDRIQSSHRSSLFDLWMKYCDVINLDSILAYLEPMGED